MPCSSETPRRFEITHHLRLQIRILNQTRKKAGVKPISHEMLTIPYLESQVKVKAKVTLLLTVSQILIITV
jgi:hypothetical protein